MNRGADVGRLVAKSVRWRNPLELTGRNRRRVAHALAFASYLASAGSVAAFPTQDDQTPGTMANQFKKRRNVWMRVDMGVLDGKVTTSPPDSTTIDRRIESYANFGGEGMLGSRFGARLNVKAESVRRRTSAHEADAPVMDETGATYTPSFDLTFVTDKGLEIFGGVEAKAFGETIREEESSNGTSKSTLSPVNVVGRRFGVTRRAGVWSGGFFYVAGAEKGRGVRIEAFDGSVNETTEVAFVPSRVGVFGEIAAGALWDFELNFVQARGMGPRDENGITAYTDYFEARFGNVVMLGSGFGLKTSLAHKTLSYASNSFVTLETIPMTSCKVLALFGDAQSHLYAGIIAGQGRDGQSLPEFNAKYEILGYAATLGFFSPF